MTAGTTPKPTTAPAVAAPSGPAMKWIWMLAAIVVGLGIAVLPTPAGLTRLAQLVLAITAGTAILWASQVINNGVASVLLMALMILAGVRPALALSGFGTPPYWTLLAVLFYGFAMKKTGLAERISYYILSLFPGTYTGILTSFFVIGFILALGIPSMTVRTAIMTPIAWALVQSLGLAPRSRGSALIILTTVEMAVVPGIAFLYGSLSGPIVAQSFAAKHIPLSWGGYAQVVTFPTLLLCIMILIVNQLVLKPEAELKASPSFAKDRLKALGPFKRPEAVTGIVVVLSIIFWATDSYHHLPAYLIGMFAMAVFAAAGILTDADMPTGVSWSLLLFLGGIFGLANVIQEYKVTDWVAGYFVPVAQHITGSVVLVMIVLSIAMYVLRFLDPSSFIALAVLFLSVVDVMTMGNIPPIVTMAPLILASVPFWMSYQNFWVAMGEGLTGNQAFNAGDRVKLSNVYAILVIVSLAISVAFWKLIGVLG